MNDPSPYEKVPATDFEWPCSRRDAHHPHQDCPGVQAHPATMSGTQVHAVRLPGYQLGVEVIFGADGQRLHLKHEAGDGSKPYVAGALLAIRKVHTVRGVVRGLDKVMEGL